MLHLKSDSWHMKIRFLFPNWSPDITMLHHLHVKPVCGCIVPWKKGTILNMSNYHSKLKKKEIEKKNNRIHVACIVIITPNTEQCWAHHILIRPSHLYHNGAPTYLLDTTVNWSVSNESACQWGNVTAPVPCGGEHNRHRCCQIWSINSSVIRRWTLHPQWGSLTLYQVMLARMVF